MWPFDEELEVHFEEVEARRKDRFGGGSSGGDSAPDGPMMSNELARGLR